MEPKTFKLGEILKSAATTAGDSLTAVFKQGNEQLGLRHFHTGRVRKNHARKTKK